MPYMLSAISTNRTQLLSAGQINAGACLNGDEIAELAANFTQRRQEGVALRPPRPKEAAPPAEGEGTGAGTRASGEVAGGGGRAGRSLLVRPPQLPLEDPTALGARDEEDISLLEDFFVKVLVISSKLQICDSTSFDSRITAAGVWLQGVV